MNSFKSYLPSFLFTLLIGSAVGTMACAPDDDGPEVDLNDPEMEESTEDAIDAFIQSLEPIPYSPSERKKGTAGPSQKSGDYQCVALPVTETRAFDEVVAFATNSSTFWAGALLRGDSVQTGVFTPISIDRAPLTISVSLENLQGAKSETIKVPKLSNYREALSDILSAKINGATPASIFLETEVVHSRKQVELALGASANIAGIPAKIAASFDFDNESKHSRYIVKFTQAYYTVDIDLPAHPHEMFAKTVGIKNVKNNMEPGSPPVYISSITYGRTVVFAFESEYSNKEFGPALQFGFTQGAEIEGDVSATYEEMLDSSKMTAYLLGGSGEDATQTVDGYAGLLKFIQQGGNYTRESPGAPIAYKMRYLSDNNPARISYTQDYSELSCERVSQNVQVTLNSIGVVKSGDQNSDKLELYGDIYVEGVSASQTLFHASKEEKIQVAEGLPLSILNDKIVDVIPQPENFFTVRASLYDHDAISSDDVICGVKEAPSVDKDFLFETGWRRDVTMTCTGSDSIVNLHFSFRPI